MGKERVVPVVYLAITGFCIVMALAQLGAGRFWLFASLALTLPWSIATYMPVMFALYVGNAIVIGLLLSVTAILNAGLLYLLLRPKLKA